MHSERKMRFWICSSIILMTMALFLGSAVQGGNGESKGWLILDGGANPPNPVVAQKFLELIGGADAPVLFVPTSVDEEQLQKAIASGEADKYPGELGLKNFKLFNTRDRNTANSEAFVAPIRTAKGIWFYGGRPGRIAQAYLGTRVQTELQEFYDRGGVIGGVSAGAKIMGSFVTHGGIEDADVHLVVSHQNHEGFGFLKNTAINAHVNQRHTEGELTEVVAAHSELLGIGIDAGTAIVVHGHSFQVIGGPDARVTITDGKQHDGKPYYFLKLGDRFDLNKRAVE